MCPRRAVIKQTFENGPHVRPVVPGGALGAMAPPDFGRSVNPISTRGTDFAHLITNGTPGFSDLPTALLISHKIQPKKLATTVYKVIVAFF